MKLTLHRKTSFILITLVALLVARPSFAASAKRNKSPKTDTLRTSASAPAQVGSTRWGLGIASSSSVIGTDATSSVHMLDDTNMIQTYFGIATTSPFVFGMGGVYKHTVSGGRKAGLHVGGGLGLGTAAGGATNTGAIGTNFFIRFLGNLGVHFTIPGVDQLFVSFDAGLALNINDGDASLAISDYGDVLGMSVHWLL